MLNWITEKLRPHTQFEKAIRGVQVRISKTDGEWFALFRAWDRGWQDNSGHSVPERVAIQGRDASDAIKRADAFIAALKPSQEDDLLVIPRAHWPEGTSMAPAALGTISKVVILPDGICAVFNADGEQLSQYQGPWDDVWSHIMRDAPVGTEFLVGFKPAASELATHSNRGWELDIRC